MERGTPTCKVYVSKEGIFRKELGKGSHLDFPSDEKQIVFSSEPPSLMFESTRLSIHTGGISKRVEHSENILIFGFLFPFDFISLLRCCTGLLRQVWPPFGVENYLGLAPTIAPDRTLLY